MTMPIAILTPKGASATGTGAAPAGNALQTGSPAKGAFAAILDKTAGDAKDGDEALNALTLTLAALLGGLFPSMTTQANSMPNPEQTGNAISQIQTVLSGHPELLQKLLNAPGLQNWLQKAQSLLQAMEASSAKDAAATDGSMPSFPLQAAFQLGSATAPSTQAQASDVIMKLLQAVQQEPGSPLLGELVEDLTKLLGGTQDGSDQHSANEASPSDDSGDTAVALQGNPLHTPVVKSLTRQPAVSVQQATASFSTTPVHVALTAAPASTASKPLSKLASLTALQLPMLHLATDSSADQTPNTAAAPADFSSLLPLLTSLDSGTVQGGANAELPEIPTTAGSFVQDMTQFVFKGLKLGENGVISEAKLSLSPAHLGQVDVKITMHDGQVAAQFMTQTSSGKEMLESQLTQLRAALQNMGLQVDRLDVSQSAQLSSNLFQDQRGAQQSFQQQQSKRQKNQGEEFAVPDPATVELQTIANLRSLAYGGFNVTA